MVTFWLEIFFRLVITYMYLQFPILPAFQPQSNIPVVAELLFSSVTLNANVLQ